MTKSASKTSPRRVRTKGSVSPPPTDVPAAAVAPIAKGKLGALVEMLRRKEGARLEELMTLTGWQAHSVRGAIAGAVKKKLGLAVVSEKSEAGRVYRITTPAAV